MAVLAQQSEFDAVSYFTLSQLPIQHGLTEPGIEIQGTAALHLGESNASALTSYKTPETSTLTEGSASSDTVAIHRPCTVFGCGCGECTLQIVQNCPNPVKTKSGFPYMDTAGLNKEEKDSLFGRLLSESRDIRRQFYAIVYKIFASLKKRGVSPTDLVVHLISLQALDPVLKDASPVTFQDRSDKLDKCTTVLEVLPVIQDYFSFFNYDVIEHIIKELGSEDDKKMLQQYEQYFKAYCKRRIYEAPPMYGTSGDCRVVMMTDNSFEKYTLNELKVLKFRLTRIFKITQHPLHLEFVQHNFQIPDIVHVAKRDQEIQQLSPQQQHWDQLPVIHPPPDVGGIEFNILPGADPAGEMQLMIETNKKLYFEWKGYGLKFHIPENVLPPKVDRSTLTIRALLPGQFELPPEYILCSAVYQIKAPVKFARPVTLEIQYCSSSENSDTTDLCFVVAHTATSKPPYRFEKQEGGIFSNNSYGIISLDHFCYIGIIVRWLRSLFSTRSLLQYCGQLYRICQQNPADWGLHFVITRDLDPEITAIREKLEEKNAEVQVDDQFPIQFQDDVITLSIPKEGVEIKGWKISCRHHPSITKLEVDNLQHSSGRALGCLFHIHWMDQQQPAYFEYEVTLKGAEPSRNYFTIIYPPLQTADAAKPTPHRHSASSTNSEITPAIVQLADLIEHVTTPQWFDLGLALGVDDSKLQAIEQDTRGDSQTGLRRMFQKWLSSCEQPSWDNVIRALRRIGENRLAAEIRQRF